MYDPTQADLFRRRLLEFPTERQDVEYKSSEQFDGKSDFSLKILKHIQGMANSGGGHIIVGVTQELDKPYEPDPNHTSEVVHTYDQTKLSQAADASVARGQSVKLVVYPTEFGNLVYPIITVQPFKRQPVVCRTTQGGILREGAVYIRRSSAETVAVSTPQDWEDLINRCVELRHDDLLQRFSALLNGRIDREPPQPSAFEKLDDWTKEMRERAFGHK